VKNFSKIPPQPPETTQKTATTTTASSYSQIKCNILKINAEEFYSLILMASNEEKYSFLTLYACWFHKK